MSERLAEVKKQLEDVSIGFEIAVEPEKQEKIPVLDWKELIEPKYIPLEKHLCGRNGGED